MSYLQKIARYYDLCHKDYKLIWHVDRCMSMHFDYWDSGTQNLKAALCRINEILAEKARIKKQIIFLMPDAVWAEARFFWQKIMGAMLQV